MEEGKGQGGLATSHQYGKKKKTHIQYSVVSGPKFTGLFAERGRSRSRSIRLDILTHSGDIRDRSLKLYEIGANFACFGPPISLREGPRTFGLDYIKRT